MTILQGCLNFSGRRFATKSESAESGRPGVNVIKLFSSSLMKRQYKLVSVQGILKGGSITVPLTSCLTGLG